MCEIDHWNAIQPVSETMEDFTSVNAKGLTVNIYIYIYVQYVFTYTHIYYVLYIWTYDCYHLKYRFQFLSCERAFHSSDNGCLNSFHMLISYTGCLFLVRLNYQPQQTQPPKGPSRKNSSCHRFPAWLQAFCAANILITSMSIWRAVKSSDCQGFLHYTLWTLASAPPIHWAPTNQPSFVSLIQLSYRRADIFRMASLAFTAVGLQTEQQSERRRRQRSIRKEDVNAPKVWRGCAEKRNLWKTWKEGTANHMAEEDRSSVHQGSLELLCVILVSIKSIMP